MSLINDKTSIEAIYNEHLLDLFQTISKKDEFHNIDKQVLTKMALEYIKEHPIETLYNLLLKMIRYYDFRLENSDNYNIIKNMAYSIPYILLIISSVTAIILLAHNRSLLILFILTGLIISYSAIPLISIPLIRIRMHEEFILMILSSYGFWKTYSFINHMLLKKM